MGVKKYSDEEVLTAIDKFINKKKQSDIEFDINKIKKRDTEEVNGKIVPIGVKISDIRSENSNLDKETINILIEQYKLILEKRYKPTEEEYFEGFDQWLRQNEGKNINQVPKRLKPPIIVNNHEIDIGVKLSMMRTGKNLFSESGMKKLVEEYGFVREIKSPKEYNRIPFEIYLKAIDKWLELNKDKTINDANSTDSVEVDGEIINFGHRLYTIKTGSRPVSNEIMKILIEKYDFIPNTDNIKSAPTDKDYLEGFEKYLNENNIKDINEIPCSAEIYVNGRLIKIGSKLSQMKGGRNLLKAESMKIMKEKYGFKTKKDLDSESGFVREIEPLKNESKNEVIKEKPYEKYLSEFNGDIEKAKEKYEKIKEINRLIQEKRKNKKTEYTINELEKEFNINFEELDKYLSQIKSDSEKDKVLYIDENETLRNYCIRHGYNYSVIYNLIKKSKEFNVPFKQIIREYLENGQKLPTRYVYDKNETLVKHILLDINVDSSSVIEDMKHSYTVDEAITRDVFKRNMLDKKYKWLELPYTFLIEELGPFSDKKSEHNIKFKDFESLLSKEEQVKLLEIYDKCSNALRKYQYLEIGFEKDHKKVKELIKKYSLTEEEIQKSMFVTLEYENKIKRTKNEVKSERLRTIQPIILSWSKLNEESRNKLIKAYSLTKEEIRMIESYDKEIKNRIEIYGELLKEHNITKEEIDTLKHYHNNNFYNVNLYK